MLEAKNYQKSRKSKYAFLLAFLLSLIFIPNLDAQSRYGVQLHTNDASDGYTLFYSQPVDASILIDTCGRIVNKWQHDTPVFHPKLTKNGSLLFLKSSGTIDSESIIEINWDNSSILETHLADSSIYLTYEVIALENSYLAIGRKRISGIELINKGFVTLRDDVDYGIDVIVEIEKESGKVLWLWDISDHLIQDEDPNLPRYGEVSNHPELIDPQAISRNDWPQEFFMINGMDYNEKLDQIALSIRKLSEILIIDHSTTLEEASGSTGGTYGKGGDLLYRWGNPANYGRGNETDQQLFYQHNPNWIEYGEHQGKMIIFNNGIFRDSTDFSSIDIIQLPIDSQGNYNIHTENAFDPSEPDFRYTSNEFYSGYQSGAKVLPNGNIYITEGDDTRYFEITPGKEIVWEYFGFRTSSYRSEKYSASYEGLANRELIGTGTVESPSSDYDCLQVDIQEPFVENHVKVTNDLLTINNSAQIEVRIYDRIGRLLFQDQTATSLDISFLRQGLYFFQIRQKAQFITIKKYIYE